MSSRRTPLSDSSDTKLCRSSRGVQSCASSPAAARDPAERAADVAPRPARADRGREHQPGLLPLLPGRVASCVLTLPGVPERRRRTRAAGRACAATSSSWCPRRRGPTATPGSTAGPADRRRVGRPGRRDPRSAPAAPRSGHRSAATPRRRRRAGSSSAALSTRLRLGEVERLRRPALLAGGDAAQRDDVALHLVARHGAGHSPVEARRRSRSVRVLRIFALSASHRSTSVGASGPAACARPGAG